MGLILMFGPVSGAHFNPVVSLVDYMSGDMNLYDFCSYVVVQVVGAIVGTIVADFQFDKPVQLSQKKRDEPHLWLGELIATVTLLLVIHGCVRTGQNSSVPYAVGGWVLAGHFFTSSTIFANPAVTIGRMFSDTFTGIRPASVGPFIAFQVLGAIFGFYLIHFFYPKVHTVKRDDNLYLRICLSDTRLKLKKQD